jgi:hypothetical protein
MATQKKARLSALATFVMVAVLGLSFAFKPFISKTEKVVSQEWFYKLTSTNPADINNPANYQSTPLPGSSCDGDDIVCRIVDVPNSSNSSVPALSLGTVTGHLTAYSTQFKPEP